MNMNKGGKEDAMEQEEQGQEPEVPGDGVMDTDQGENDDDMDLEKERPQASGGCGGGHGPVQAPDDGGGAMDVDQGENENVIGDPEKVEHQVPRNRKGTTSKASARTRARAGGRTDARDSWTIFLPHGEIRVLI